MIGSDPKHFIRLRECLPIFYLDRPDRRNGKEVVKETGEHYA